MEKIHTSRKLLLQAETFENHHRDLDDAPSRVVDKPYVLHIDQHPDR